MGADRDAHNGTEKRLVAVHANAPAARAMRSASLTHTTPASRRLCARAAWYATSINACVCIPLRPEGRPPHGDASSEAGVDQHGPIRRVHDDDDVRRARHEALLLRHASLARRQRRL